MKIKIDSHGNLVRRRVEMPIDTTSPTVEFVCNGMRGGAKIKINGVEKDLLSFSVNWDNGRGRIVYTEFEVENE